MFRSLRLSYKEVRSTAFRREFVLVTVRSFCYKLPPNRPLKKDAAPPPTLRWWGGDCQATPYVRQSGPPPTPRRWRRDWRLSAVGFKPLLAWQSCLHRHGVGGGRKLNHSISRSVITPPTQGWWRCSVVFQQPAKGEPGTYPPGPTPGRCSGSD